MKKNRTLIVVILLCVVGSLWALYPTWQAAQYREELASLKDSASRAKWIAANEESFKTASGKSIKLGLDMRGGIYVTMEVDLLNLI